MNKTLTLLLASSMLLAACGAEEAVEIETEAAEEEIDRSQLDAADPLFKLAEEEDEEDLSEDEEKDASETLDKDAYFSDNYAELQDDTETRLDDASDIAGLYAFTLKDDDSGFWELPRHRFVDIKEDGRVTVLTYTTIDPIVNPETNQITDASTYAILQDYQSSPTAELRDAIQNVVNQDLSLGGTKAAVSYVNENNQMTLLEENAPLQFNLSSGYLVQEYGKTVLKTIDHATITPYYNEQGEISLSALVTPSQNYIKRGSANSFDPTFSPESSSLTEISADAVPAPFLLDGEGLMSVTNSYHLIRQLENEREGRRAQLQGDESDANYPFVENYNELMHLLAMEAWETSVGMSTATDPSEYVGYTRDNIKVVPDIVFLQYDSHATTMLEDGTVMRFNDNNDTWDRVDFY